jgi:uncharacterized paraquat-inducible protein A
MKYTMMFMFALLLLVTACGSDKQEQQDPAKQQMQQDTVQASFYCPMKCEGEKTYAEMGSCPVCGMDLVETKADAETDMHEGQDHEGHNH